MGRAVTALLALLPTLGFAQQLAFPSAEGWGRFTKGGRGGIVCHVDVLTDAIGDGNVIPGTPHHRGSIRYCMNLNQPRTIVFDKGGEIALTSILDAKGKGDMTIACQTAPVPTAITRRQTDLRAAEIIVRHCRFRNGSGDFDVGTNQGEDALRIGFAPNVRNIIIDHSQILWGRDENLEVTGGDNGGPYASQGTCEELEVNAKGDLCPKYITVQWSISGESFGGTPPQGAESVAKLNQELGINYFSELYNILMHATRRIPLHFGGDHEFIGNTVYNFYGIGEASSNWQAYWDDFDISLVSNYWKPGPSTAGDDNAMIKPAFYDSTSRYYLLGNRHPTKRPNDTLPEEDFLRDWDAEREARRTENISDFNAKGFKQGPFLTAEQYQTLVFADGGAGPYVPSKDTTDQRLLDDVINGTGVVKRDFRDIPGGTWPTMAEGERPLGFDSDWDGLPDTWEDTYNLNKNDPLDGAQFATDGSGYTNLEIYLNNLAGDDQSTPPPDTTPPNPPSNLQVTASLAAFVLGVMLFFTGIRWTLRVSH